MHGLEPNSRTVDPKQSRGDYPLMSLDRPESAGKRVALYESSMKRV